MTQQQWNHLFIGREKELAWLQQAWADVKSGQARFCVLNGHSGFGKTKIVQAFYSWLSSDTTEDPDQYWPDTLMQEGNNLRVNPLGEDFTQADNIPWLWWGLRWTSPDERNRDEGQNCAFIDNLHHLEPHRQSLNSHAEKIQRSKQAGIEAVTSIAELASFGLVSTLKSLYELGGLYRQEKQAQQEQSLTISEQRAHSIEAQLDIIYSFFQGLLTANNSHYPTLPVVLVLDDAQWIDANSLQLLQRLFSAAQAKQWPLLILATHWEQDWNLNAESKDDSLPRLFHRYAKTSPDSCQIKKIDRINGLAAILDAAFPGLTDQQRDFICQRADGNPRLLNEIILELKDEPLYFADEDFEQMLTEEALSEMASKSFALHDVQKRRFKRLDHALKQLLSYASFQGMRFIKQLVLDISKKLDKENSTADDSLQLAVYPQAMLVAESALIYEFRHRVFHDLAQQRLQISPTLQTSLINALLQVGQTWLKEGKDENVPAEEKEMLYRLMLQYIPSTAPVNKALQLQLLSKLLNHYYYSGYIAKANPWLPLLEELLQQRDAVGIAGIDFWQQIGLVDLLVEANQWSLAEKIARDLLVKQEKQLLEFGESAQRLRDISLSQSKIGDILRVQDQPEPALQLYQQSLATYLRIVEEFGESAERLRDVSVSQDRVGDILQAQDQLEPALQLYQQSLATRLRIVQEFGESAQRLRDISVAQEKVGDILRVQDQLEPALQLYQQSLATRLRIVEEFGESAQRLRDISIAQEKVGDILQTQDQLEPALQLYQQSLATYLRIVEEFGESAQRLRDISLSQSKIGDILQAQDQLEPALQLYQQSLATGLRIVEEFGESAERLRDVSVSQGRVGDILQAQDQLEPALQLYQQSLTTYPRIVEEFGESAERLRDISVSQHRVGDILQAQDQLEPALQLYQQSLATYLRIVEQFGESAQRLRDVSVSQSKIGDILQAQDQLEPALQLYQQSLATGLRIVEQLGESAQRLRDISTSQERVGDILQAQDQLEPALQLYQQSLATRLRIVEEFGESAQRLRDISTSQERVGDILRVQDQPEPALQLYQQSLATCLRIVEEFGESAQRLRDVSISQIRVGDILQAQDQLEPALQLYQQSLATGLRIVEEFGESAERLRDISVAQSKIGDILRVQDQPEPALQLYQQSLATGRRIVEEFGESAQRLHDLMVSHYKLFGILAQQNDMKCIDMLQKAIVINVQRMTTYPQYAQSVVAEHETLIDMFSRFAEAMKDEALRADASAYADNLTAFKREQGLLGL